MSKRQLWFCQDCRIVMEYNEGDDFYKCPRCKGEFWPGDTGINESQEEIADLMQESFNMHKLSEAILPSGGRGNSGKAKRNNKLLLQRPSTAQLYNQMVTTKNRILKPPGRPRKDVDN